MARNAPRRRLNVFLLLPLAFLVLLLVVAGLVIDVARVAQTRNQAKKAAQSAAEAAAAMLDGSAVGIRRARQKVADRIHIERETGIRLDLVQVEFAPGPEGPWKEAPPDPAFLRSVRVRAFMSTTMLVASLVVSGDSRQVYASAVASQVEQKEFHANVLPYAVLAHDNRAPTYGLEPGRLYTLRWPQRIAPGGGNVCEGDREEEVLRRAAETYRGAGGFIEMEYEPLIDAAILEGLQKVPGRIGTRLQMRPGRLDREHQALLKRIHSDTDPHSGTYADYSDPGVGNGRRIVAVMIQSGAPEFRVVQVAAFLLLPAERYSLDPDQPFCAEYIGSYLEGSTRRGTAPAGYYAARLVD